jgi:hypothetical protein
MREEVQKSEKGNSSTIDCHVSSMPRNLPDPPVSIQLIVL